MGQRLAWKATASPGRAAYNRGADMGQRGRFVKGGWWHGSMGTRTFWGKKYVSPFVPPFVPPPKSTCFAYRTNVITKLRRSPRAGGGTTMHPAERLCLKYQVAVNERGHLQVEGYCGGDRIVVELDASVAGDASEQDRIAVILRKHALIQGAARRKYAAGEARRVHYPYSDRYRHHLIALTDQDLIEA